METVRHCVSLICIVITPPLEARLWLSSLKFSGKPVLLLPDRGLYPLVQAAWSTLAANQTCEASLLLSFRALRQDAADSLPGRAQDITIAAALARSAVLTPFLKLYLGTLIHQPCTHHNCTTLKIVTDRNLFIPLTADQLRSSKAAARSTAIFQSTCKIKAQGL